MFYQYHAGYWGEVGSCCNNLGQRGGVEQGGCSRGGEKISVKNSVNESTVQGYQAMEWETELRQVGSYSLGSAIAYIIDSEIQPGFSPNPACGKPFNLIHG